jgi:hypothetical protein
MGIPSHQGKTTFLGICLPGGKQLAILWTRDTKNLTELGLRPSSYQVLLVQFGSYQILLLGFKNN